MACLFYFKLLFEGVDIYTHRQFIDYQVLFRFRFETCSLWGMEMHKGPTETYKLNLK